VTLRWGSHLAVLLDRDKPVWTEVHSASTSRICDQEMARVNIEASAALAEWIDLFRADPGGPLYEQFVNRAVSYLPRPKKHRSSKLPRLLPWLTPRFRSHSLDVSSRPQKGRPPPIVTGISLRPPESRAQRLAYRNTQRKSSEIFRPRQPQSQMANLQGHRLKAGGWCG
jgi:hypothetical protein